MKLHSPKPAEFRVMTYNVHSCIGTDKRHNLDRIAQVIGSYNPDIVALQELDNGHSRSSQLHQAERIAEKLQLHFHYHSVREISDQQFGNAILCRYPMGIIRAGGLPTLKGRPRVESRGALWVELEIGGRALQFLTTHFGLWPKERVLQAQALLGKEWLGNRNVNAPLIVCGDFNAIPKTEAYRQLTDSFADVQKQMQKQISTYRARKTFPSRFPLARLDHIFHTQNLMPMRIEVPQNALTKLASDHLPVVADIAFRDSITEPQILTHKKGGKHAA